MSTRWAPHWQLLSAGWRMSSTLSAFRVLTVGLLVAGLACLAGATPWVEMPVIRQGFALLSVVPLAFLWVLHSATLMRLNHPVDARLVPRQLRCLQETLLGLWLTFTAAAGAAVVLAAGQPFANSVLITLLAAACALLPLLWMRWPLVSVPIALVWLASVFLGETSLFKALVRVCQGVGRSLLQLPAWSIALVSVIALLALARLLTRGVIRAGGDAHTSRFRASLVASGKPPVNQPQPAAALSWTLGAPGPVLQRVVGMRLDRGTVWRMLLPYAAVVLAACSGLWFQSALTATITLGVACVWSVALPLTTRSARMAQSAKEHAPWMLLPGMPQGTALNRALAKHFLKQGLVTWVGVAVLSLVPGFFPLTPDGWDGTWLWLIVTGLLPSLVFAVNDWSRLPLAPTTLPAPGSALWCVLGPLLCVAAYAMGAALWLPMLVSLLATVLALGWRWKQLNHYPAALPAGRLQ